MSTTKTTDIPITNLKGNVMQKLAGKYMPLIILSSAIIVYCRQIKQMEDLMLKLMKQQ